ncbi:hypothetical protein [Priestia sp. J2]|uniref:hypothetical protein n=1 Tax=Priestia sp. J2 TaxID=2886505 RepID=UPI001E461CF5|nr:hypothetical protein [Priestia sp. J2]
MTKLFNVIVEVNAEFINTVKASSVVKAWKKAVMDTNSFTTHFNTDIEFMTVTGERMSFRWCDNDFEVEEIYNEFENEYKACGNMNLVMMQDIQAISYEKAEEYAQETFNDCFLSMGNVTVVNHDMKDVKLSIANYEIEVGSIERVYGEEEENVENFQKVVYK